MQAAQTQTAAQHPDREGTAESQPDRRYYEAGGGRKTFFAVLFMVLLPFFVSLPPMIWQRVVNGVWFDTWGLLVIATAFLLVMVLVFFELMFSLRAKVDLGTRAVAFTLPASGGGMIPTFSYETRLVEYAEIASVETFREVYGGWVAPIMKRGVRLITKSGERVLLGYSNEADDDPKFPFLTIGNQIAARANVDVVHRGNIVHEFHVEMFGGAPAGQSALTEEEFAAVNRRHSLFISTLVALLALLLLLGIGNDIWSSGEDTGERAPSAPISVRG